MPQDPLRLQEQLCFGLVTAARNVVAFYRPFLEPLGLTHPQYLVMLALWEDEPVSLGRLGELLMLEPATLSPLVKRLEAAGLLQRGRSATDERRLEVTLTARGRDLRLEAERIPAGIVERLGMDVEELVDLRERLSRLGAAMAAPDRSTATRE